jgi:hypothetical protein
LENFSIKEQLLFFLIPLIVSILLEYLFHDLARGIANGVIIGIIFAIGNTIKKTIVIRKNYCIFLTRYIVSDMFFDGS